MSRPRVVLVHWHAGEAAERQARLEALGYDVTVHCDKEDGGALTRTLAGSLPDAVVVDLARLPSHGRAIATWMRQRKASRTTPIVFVPGDAEKTDRLREAFPDATYATWSRMKAALPKAIASPPREPVVPAGRDYSGTPLPKKLGVKDGTTLCLVRAPRGFGETLGDLPKSVRVRDRFGDEAHVLVVFCRALREVQADFRRAADDLAEAGSLWIAWPKKTSGVMTDLTEDVVRAVGLDHGLVDTKVCAIDAVWSGLRFSRRRAVR